MARKVATSVTVNSGVRFIFPVAIVMTMILIMPAMAETWTVCPSGCNFTTIQEAINSASEGDTILIMAGEYHEHIVVNKTLTIEGGDANTTVINGSYSGNVLTVVADRVVVKNIQVKGSIRKKPDVETWPGYGIGVFNVSGVTIDSCIVTDNQVGINGDVTSELLVSGNDISGNDVQGILLDHTTSSVCRKNTVHDNYFGIMAFRSKTNFFCTDNQIIHNRYTGLGFLDGLERALIDGNLIQDNTYEDFESLGDYNRAGGYFESLDHVMINNNRFIHNGGVGLFVDGMSQSYLNGNILEGNYAGFSYHDGNPAPGNTVELSNTVDGLPVLYLEGVQDRDITGSEYATIYLVGCRNITVHDMVMASRNGFGILVRGGEHITIRDNSISNNLYQNILVSHVENAKIVSNRLEGAMYGAGVIGSSFVNLTGNHAVGNSAAGLAAASENEHVWFFNNILEGNRAGFSFEDEYGREISVTGNRIVGNDPSLQLMDLGIFIKDSDRIHFWNNEVSSVYESVFLWGGEMNILEDNTMSDCTYGIEISPFNPGFGNITFPAMSNWVVRNDISARKIAFFTTSDQKDVYSNYIYLNNFRSVEEPPAITGIFHPPGWFMPDSPGTPLAWGLPSSGNLTAPLVPETGTPFKDNTFNTEEPVFYNYGGKTFKGYLGNYWNWYAGTDTDGNGVGTTPYPVRVNNTDRYPLLAPVSSYEIDPSPSFRADFDASPSVGVSPLTVQFTDHSTGNPTRYLYRFGDGFMSMSKNPVHTYNRPGNYTVSLTIWKMDGRKMVNATTIRPAFITVEKKTEPEAEIDFTGTPLSGKAPLKVSFTGMSTVKPILWKYSFGDGFMATQQNATHTYRKPGTYNVTLTVWTMGPDKIPVTHKVEKTGYITVT